MFEVECKGANAVVLTTKSTKVVIDPALSVVGLKDLRVDGAVIVATESRFVGEKTGAKVVIDGPGEYEVGDVGMVGLPAQRHLDADGKVATIYRLTIGEVRLAVIGNIAPKLSDDQLEAIGVVDAVIMPVGGGGYTLDATAAATMVRQLDPKVVIPVHYADDGLRYEVPQAELSVFVGELGAPVIEAGTKWKLKQAGALPEQLTLVKIDRN
ncbi:MAG: MBL fold metallo-hydrolase [Candidatus Saccharibacteria bacterium]|nr:MBL fold metallo-hydrolase [Candidatus Saccharibacteria bacterium]